MYLKARKKILLVENDVKTALAESERIRSFGYDVIVVHDGERAAQSATRSTDLDLVLMNINLATGVDSAEAARLILEKKSIPIVFLVAFAECDMVDRVRGIARYGYIIKDSGDAVLRSSIELALELFEAQQRISERKRAEDAFRENQRRLETLISNLPGIAYRCLNDRDWTMEFISQGCESLTGYRLDELIGSKAISYNEVIHESDRDMVRDAVQEGVSNRRQYQMEYRIRTKQGAIKWVWEQGRGYTLNQGRCLRLKDSSLILLIAKERSRRCG